MEPKYQQGDRVSDIERCTLAKIVGLAYEKDTNRYRLRAYTQPHDIWWTDESSTKRNTTR